MFTRTRRLALLVVAGACASAPPPPPATPPEPPPPPLPSPDYMGEPAIEALAVLLRMEDRRALELSTVERLAADSSALVRSRTVLAAGRLRDHAATPLLVVALGDEHPKVRADAAFALGLMGDTASTALDALAGTALDRDPRYTMAAIEAVSAIGRLGAPPNTRAPATAATRKAAFVIRTILERHLPAPADTTAPAPLRPDLIANEALVTLWRLPDPGSWLDVVVPFFGAPESATRWRAIYPFARQGAPAGLMPHLLARMNDPNPVVRSMAARALRAGPATDGDRDAVHAALVTALRDADQHVRINAVASLATFRDAGSVDFAAALLTDPVGNVVVAAIQAVTSLGGPAAADLLAPIVDDGERALGIRHAALTGLLSVAPERGMARVRAWLTAADWLERFHAIRALGRNAGSAVETLQQLVRDPDPRVATAALRALAPLDSVAPATHVFLEGLAANDPALRAAAVTALGRNAGAAWFDVLMEAYERAQADSVPIAALAAVDALARLEELGVPIRRAFFLRFPRSRFPAVHRRVVQQFGDAEWGPAPEPAPRDLEFYRTVVRTFVVPWVRDGAVPHALVGTPHGEIQLELAAGIAPLTVLNFVELAEIGFYANPQLPGSHGHRWHRVVPNFVLQDGEPRGDGSGRPDESIRDEINRLRYERGVLGMALSGPDTGGGQFFITHSPQPHLDGGYTVFGRVVAGMDAADMVVQDDAVLYIRIVR